MKLTRLKITGFKSFVEPTEVLIEPGLTGVVGPNGCGKSNLVEALRWVMGENSHKSMRASGMDDVIFAGSGARPARNTADVTLVIDNADRRAPAAFNDKELLEVSRHIEREEGSTYRINGREVRARDVQLLFADAATGARSPALVRQGQIGEIIAAKPQARRRILEDAAGIAGLHARRHEAELRLKAAEDNLVRLQDVMKEIETQADSLKRQGRQATRYKNVSAEIRRLEAQQLLVGYSHARDQAAQAERALEADIRVVADRTQEQAETARQQALAAAALPALRDSEAHAAAGLQRLNAALTELDAEERRMRERMAELERRVAETEKDIAREVALMSDAAATIERLSAEQTELVQGDDAGDAEATAQAQVASRDSLLATTEASLAEVQGRLFDLNARRGALERSNRDEGERAARLAAEREAIERDLAELADDTLPALDALRGEISRADLYAAASDEAVNAARAALAEARERESASRAALTQAERAAASLETEARTLAKLFAEPAGATWPAMLDAITVAKGYEMALGAAFGDDLDASTEAEAPAHWRATSADGDPALPEGVHAMASVVTAPAALMRRLNQIGIVERVDGERLRGLLAPGQRLVSREGDLWRWDGYTAAAEAPSAAARRLAERNRLGDLEAQAREARAQAELLKGEADASHAAIRDTSQLEGAALEAAREARRNLDDARQRLGEAERAAAEAASRRSALSGALSRITLSETEAVEKVAAAASALEAFASPAELEHELARLRAEVAEQRVGASEARATLQSLLREAEAKARRREVVAADIRAWSERAARSEAARQDMGARLAAARAEQDQLVDAPAAFQTRRRALVAEIEIAEARRRDAADRLAEGETAQAVADRAAREALDGLSQAREVRAGAEARLEATKHRLDEMGHAIAESLGTNADGLFSHAGMQPGDPLPDIGKVEERLGSLRAERERLGAVNLRADEELAEVVAKSDSLTREHDDLTEAIRRLRQAIGNLNREGRERLLAAFDVVNGHFQRLFTTLFGGGTAELKLVDSDDPLEAGLEIFARPPGKKTQVMTLLSGGEQALTATALIFAVFLTNPSPICVLDEVDAPLDDANVERYCDLLVDMVRQSETRFVVITHNPITMARMDRLFGVTMAERGVSQLVSVDLEGAERIREAG
jgi:chromosome segregation protein